MLAYTYDWQLQHKCHFTTLNFQVHLQCIGMNLLNNFMRCMCMSRSNLLSKNPEKKLRNHRWEPIDIETHRCIRCDGLPLARNGGDGGVPMGRSGNMIHGKGRRSGGWTSYKCGCWSNNAMYRGLGKRTSGYLSRGISGNSLALALAIALASYQRTFLGIGRRNWIIFCFSFFLQFNHLRGRANEVAVEEVNHLGHKSTRSI